MKLWYGLVLVTFIVATLVFASCTSRQKAGETPAQSTLVVTTSPSQKDKPAATTTPPENSEDTGADYSHRILATGEPGVNEYSTKPPGQSTVLPREYPGAPPLIPHSVSGLTITKDRNACLGCHLQGLSLGPDHTATKIPESHYIDIPTGEKSQDLQPIRYNCIICHIPQSSETPPLEK